MENKEILEGNKLIAEFDGWILTDEFPDKNRTYTKNGTEVFSLYQQFTNQ